MPQQAADIARERLSERIVEWDERIARSDAGAGLDIGIHLFDKTFGRQLGNCLPERGW